MYSSRWAGHLSDCSSDTSGLEYSFFPLHCCQFIMCHEAQEILYTSTLNFELIRRSHKKNNWVELLLLMQMYHLLTVIDY